ncbi:hypothetical protein J6590_032245 [Homalodisca vitripennis]|nr:hypothetical protein J6590_032245 [Homalodisca vitripennis]
MLSYRSRPELLLLLAFNRETRSPEANLILGAREMAIDNFTQSDTIDRSSKTDQSQVNITRQIIDANIMILSNHSPLKSPPQSAGG